MFKSRSQYNWLPPAEVVLDTEHGKRAYQIEMPPPFLTLPPLNLGEQFLRYDLDADFVIGPIADWAASRSHVITVAALSAKPEGFILAVQAVRLTEEIIDRVMGELQQFHTAFKSADVSMTVLGPQHRTSALLAGGDVTIVYPKARKVGEAA